MSSQLITHIRKFIALSDEDAELVLARISTIKLKRREYVLTAGQRCKANYFVVKGCMRLYFISNKDTEQITHFGLESWWITDYDSLERQQPSHFYIQAIEHTELLVLEPHIEQELLARIPALERYFRLILQKAFTAAQRRMEYIYNMTDEERYHFFISSFPDFNQRVPQYMIASYLGVTPQFISRIRSKGNKIS